MIIIRKTNACFSIWPPSLKALAFQPRVGDYSPLKLAVENKPRLCGSLGHRSPIMVLGTSLTGKNFLKISVLDEWSFHRNSFLFLFLLMIMVSKLVCSTCQAETKKSLLSSKKPKKGLAQKTDFRPSHLLTAPSLELAWEYLAYELNLSQIQLKVDGD
jgi:hypothetical protein